MTDDRVREARLVVGNYVEPHLGMPLADAKAVKSVRFEDGRVRVEIELGFPLERGRVALQEHLGRLLAGAPTAGPAEVIVTCKVAAQPVEGAKPPLPGISNVIAVASGKGGVGKSTTAVNLALALALDGAKVGLLDADIYGPSQPRMMGLQGQRPVSTDGRRMDPLVSHGVKVMSIGFLVEEEQPMVWRGPMVTQALTQLLAETNWGELDYLVVDMPPGTGDIQLTLAQRVPVSGAVVVTTPQDIALLDARKGLRMFQKVAVPVLGIVENMGTHVCSKCGHEEPIFGSGGGRAMAEQYGVALLASLPLDIRIREQTDGGRPTVVAEPDGPLGRAYLEMARCTAARLSIAHSAAGAAPRITVEDT
ncbi:MAG: iron-sulfur cluster carrier protein ApbC [Steroidobacteraceae bacterium]